MTYFSQFTHLTLVSKVILQCLSPIVENSRYLACGKLTSENIADHLSAIRALIHHETVMVLNSKMIGTEANP